MSPSVRIVALALLASSASALVLACSDDDSTLPLPVYDGSVGSSVDSGSGGDAGMSADGAATDGATDAAGDSGATDAGADGATDAATDAAPSSCDGGAAMHSVSVGKTAFTPAALTICPGDTVTWTWTAANQTVTSGTNCTADNKFCSPNDMTCAQANASNSGFTYSHTFTTAGSYPYFSASKCTAGMTGTITVQ